MLFDLPKTLDVGGKEWDIRTDYRDILTVITAFDDPDLESREKVYVCLKIVYVDFENMDDKLYGEAFAAAMKFIDHNSGDGHSPKTMDWEQDAPLLFPAINRVAGYEIRSVEYLHWWTFLGMFLEIKDGVYSTVLTLRGKRARHKKFEKWEKEWWNQNLSICKLRTRYSQAELEEQAQLKAKLGE